MDAPCNTKDNAMLDYELMMQHVVSIDATNHDDVRFTVSPDNTLGSNTECRFVRRINGWGVRCELWINDVCYESDVLMLSTDGCLHHRLRKLYDALMNRRYTLADDKRTAQLGWIDTMQDMMANA